MRILQALSETSLGSALVAYFFDLPRWALMNVLCALAFLPAYYALTNGAFLWVAFATLPVVPVLAGMMNMSASHVFKNAPRLKQMWLYPATLVTVFLVWLGVVIFATLLVADVPFMLVVFMGMLLLSLLMIGVFAVFLPSQLKVKDGLVWRNALVLAVTNPIVGLGMIALAVVGAWAIWISKGALIVVVPSLWVLMAAFTVDDRIKQFNSTQNETV